ncbi:MAG: ion transporter [Bacteroidota bacterium]
MIWNRLRQKSAPKVEEELLLSDEHGEDLGIGEKVGRKSGTRLIGSDGRFLVERRGQSFFSAYSNLVDMTWTRFLLLVSLSIIGINLLFGIALNTLPEGHIGGIEPGQSYFMDLANCYFLSFQTFTTVGYGIIHPVSTTANFMTSVISLTGLLTVALATGLVFARFSRPRQLIAFSKQAIIRIYKNNKKALLFRIANLRDDNLIDLRANVVLSWLEKGIKGPYRKFAPLKLERDQVALFPLNWTIVHEIDENSPLAKWTKSDITRGRIEIIVNIQGFDEAYGQTIHAKNSYTSDEIEWNACFVPMYYEEGGRTVLELDKLSVLEEE